MRDRGLCSTLDSGGRRWISTPSCRHHLTYLVRLCRKRIFYRGLFPQLCVHALSTWPCCQLTRLKTPRRVMPAQPPASSQQPWTTAQSRLPRMHLRLNTELISTPKHRKLQQPKTMRHGRTRGDIHRRASRGMPRAANEARNIQAPAT